MKLVGDVLKSMPVIAALALGIIGIFYLSNDGGTSGEPPVVTDASPLGTGN